MSEQKSTAKHAKRRLPLIIISIILIMIGTGALTWTLYDQAYQGRRVTDPHRNVYFVPEEMEEMQSTVHEFKNNHGDTLVGRLYTKKDSIAKPSALIVFSHGLGAGHFPYLSEIQELVKENFAVFAYDATANGESGGDSLIGFPQAIFDLRSALAYVGAQPEMNTLKLGLYGHASGAYAAMTILQEDFPVRAVVERSGPISSRAYFIEDSKKSVSTLAYSFFPFLTFVEKQKFGFESSYNAVEAVNESKVPVMAMHSKDDDKVAYSIGLPAKEKSITNDQMLYRTYEDKGHDLILTDDARAYREEVLKGMVEVLTAHDGWPPADIMQAYTDTVDKDRLNAIDMEIMTDIIYFFTEHLCGS